MLRPLLPKVSYAELIENAATLAQERNEEKLKTMLEQKEITHMDIRFFVIKNLIRKRDYKSIDFLTRLFEIPLHCILTCYAECGDTNKVNELIAKGVYWKYALLGYREQLLETKNILPLLSQTNSKTFRTYLADEAVAKIPSLNTRSLLRKANILHRLIRENGFTFDQAYDYYSSTITKSNTWLFQAHKLIQAIPLPLDVWMIIISLALDPPINNTEQLLDTYNQRLRNGVIENYNPGCFGFFRCSIPKEMHTQLQEERYQGRMLRPRNHN